MWSLFLFPHNRREWSQWSDRPVWRQQGWAFITSSKCLCEHSGSGSVFVLPDTTAEVGTIAGIASAVAMALVGAISSYISYQKKKLCFSIQRKATPHTGFRGAAPQSVQSSFIYTAPKHSSRTRLRVWNVILEIERCLSVSKLAALYYCSVFTLK